MLFTDLVGSTELAASLTPEAGDDVRRKHFSALRRAIASTGGIEVKNLGDGLMVVFPIASAALSCAVAMQQAVDQDNAGAARSLGLRVGLSAGEATREADDYFGDPVIEAARLCARAEGGQILAADLVRANAGRRTPFTFSSLGEVELKGLPDPIETLEVAWEPKREVDVATTSVPLPARLEIVPITGVVARDVEVQILTDTYKRVAAEESREVVLVSGEAGLGKTTLLAEAARAALASGACVLFGHCEEDLATPYQLFAEALKHYVTHAPEEHLLTHVEEHGSELARLVPTLNSRIPGLPPSKATDTDTERFLLFAAVVGLLATMSAHQPVVIVLDDLQWADKGSLLLLRHLVASDEAKRVLILGTYRDSELSQSHPLLDTLAALRRQRGFSRIELTGLDDSGVLSLMEAAAGQTLDDDGVGLAHAVYRETDGNPFFVSEVLRHLAETRAIFQDASGRWTAQDSPEQMALPDSVREVIGARVGRLGPEAGRVLSMAAVIGRDFDLDLLAKATDTSDDDLLDILDAAAAVALVRELGDTGRYNFAHALIQHTLYEDLGHNRRARAHRQVAEALEELCRDRPGNRVGELARHWMSASQPIDLAKAISYSRQAGDAALNALAPADALRYYAQALDLYPQASDPDATLGIDLAIGLGTAQRQTGDPAFRDTLLGAARRAADLGDTERLVAAALANNRGWMSVVGFIDADRVDILEVALARLPASHPDRAQILATLTAELTYGSPIDRRQALADEAVAIARVSGDETTLLRVLNQVAYPLTVPQQLSQLRARCDEALALAERVGDPAQFFWAAMWANIVALLAGDIEERDRCQRIIVTIAEQLDQPVMHWLRRMGDVIHAQVTGDVELAERCAVEAHQLGTDAGEPDADLFFGSHLLAVNLQRGNLGDLIPTIEQLSVNAPDIAKGVFDSALVMAYVEADRFDEARQLLARSASEGFDLAIDPTWLPAMTWFASAVTECGAEECAEPLYRHLAPWADLLATNGGATATGQVSHYLGGLATVLARYDEAETHFSQSAAFHERIGAAFFAAQTDLLWGRMLAERRAPGDTERARSLLTEAHTAAVANGYRNVERRAKVALQLLDA